MKTNIDKSLYYEVWRLIPDGPDDVVWDLDSTFQQYTDAIRYATAFAEKGFKVKIFDPYVGSDFNFPEEF